MKLVIGAAIAAAVMLSASAAEAGVITFDDLGGANATVANGYADLNWTNVKSVDGTAYPYGYGYGIVSQKNVAYNSGGNLGTFGADDPFTFNSAYFTSAFGSELVEVLGYAGDTQIFSKSFTAGQSPIFESFGWSGLTKVTFIGGAGGPLTQVVLDNIDVTFGAPAAVPEPANWALLIVGFGLTGTVLRRRSRPILRHACQA